LGLTAGSHAASLEEIRARGYMTIATEDSYAPFEIIENGEPTGFTHDMVAAMREFADFEIRQDILPWTGLLAAVAGGQYDAAITGAIVSVERLGPFEFAPPTAAATHYYIKRAGDDRIQSIADLSGKTVGVQAGSVLLTRLPELEAMLTETGGSLGPVVEYVSYPEAYEDLANGRLDYVVNSIIGAQALVRERGDVFEIGEAVSGPGFHAWPVQRGNESLLMFLTEFVTHMRETGQLAALQEKWFGQAFPDLPTEPIRSVEEFAALTAPSM
ncbi:MAG: transporter substrate-binding domain-containing protein, partial [Rubrimonas sp.]